MGIRESGWHQWNSSTAEKITGHKTVYLDWGLPGLWCGLGALKSKQTGSSLLVRDK